MATCSSSWRHVAVVTVLLPLLLACLGPPVTSTHSLNGHDMPTTNFSCIGKVIGGYYADQYTNCQMFHVCTLNEKGKVNDYTFRCLAGTVFDQETRVCERAEEVDCSRSETFFHLNNELYGPGIIPYTAHIRVIDAVEETARTDSSARTADLTITTTTTTTTTPAPRFVFPETSFSCIDKIHGGLYADVETGCKVFHICSVEPDKSVKDSKFVCGPGTLFNQKTRTCQVESAVDCISAPTFYYLNDRGHLPGRSVDLCVSRPLGSPLADITTGCHHYSTCEKLVDGRLVETRHECKKGLLFSQLRKRCVLAKKVECVKETLSEILGLGAAVPPSGGGRKRRAAALLSSHRFRRAALQPLVNLVVTPEMEDARVRRALYNLAALQQWTLENAQHSTFIELYSLPADSQDSHFPQKKHASAPAFAVLPKNYGYVLRRKRDLTNVTVEGQVEFVNHTVSQASGGPATMLPVQQNLPEAEETHPEGEGDAVPRVTSVSTLAFPTIATTTIGQRPKTLAALAAAKHDQTQAGPTYTSAPPSLPVIPTTLSTFTVSAQPISTPTVVTVTVTTTKTVLPSDLATAVAGLHSIGAGTNSPFSESSSSHSPEDVFHGVAATPLLEKEGKNRSPGHEVTGSRFSQKDEAVTDAPSALTTLCFLVPPKSLENTVNSPLKSSNLPKRNAESDTSLAESSEVDITTTTASTTATTTTTTTTTTPSTTSTTSSTSTTPSPPSTTPETLPRTLSDTTTTSSTSTTPSTTTSSSTTPATSSTTTTSITTLTPYPATATTDTTTTTPSTTTTTPSTTTTNPNTTSTASSITTLSSSEFLSPSASNATLSNSSSADLSSSETTAPATATTTVTTSTTTTSTTTAAGTTTPATSTTTTAAAVTTSTMATEPPEAAQESSSESVNATTPVTTSTTTVTTQPSIPTTTTTTTTTTEVEETLAASTSNDNGTSTTSISSTTTVKSITEVVVPPGSINVSTTVVPDNTSFVANTSSSPSIGEPSVTPSGPFTSENLPETNFTCKDKKLEQFYPDPEANCQVFHYCLPGFLKKQVLDLKFLCTGATKFDVKTQKCQNMETVTCGQEEDPIASNIIPTTTTSSTTTTTTTITTTTGGTTTSTAVTPETPDNETIVQEGSPAKKTDINSTVSGDLHAEGINETVNATATEVLSVPETKNTTAKILEAATTTTLRPESASTKHTDRNTTKHESHDNETRVEEAAGVTHPPETPEETTLEAVPQTDAPQTEEKVEDTEESDIPGTTTFSPTEEYATETEVPDTELVTEQEEEHPSTEASSEAVTTMEISPEAALDAEHVTEPGPFTRAEDTLSGIQTTEGELIEGSQTEVNIETATLSTTMGPSFPTEESSTDTSVSTDVSVVSSDVMSSATQVSSDVSVSSSIHPKQDAS